MYNNSIAIVKRLDVGLDLSRNSLINVDDIWLFKSNTWIPVSGFRNKSYKVKLVHLNNDKLIDLIFYGGCCDTMTYNIFLGDPINIFKYIQRLTAIGRIQERIENSCDSHIWVRHYQDPSQSKHAFFDCRLNKFIIK